MDCCWALTIIVVEWTAPVASVVVVVTVTNVVGRGDDGDDVVVDGGSVASGDEVVLILEDLRVEDVGFGVAEGIRLARDGGRVVCPDVRTAHIPARTIR